MATQTPEMALEAVARGDRPVLEELLHMQVDSFERSGLDERTYLIARLSALVAIDAAPASYLVHLARAKKAGMTAAEAQGVLVAIAPVIGSARVTSAAGAVVRALEIGEAIKERREETH